MVARNTDAEVHGKRPPRGLIQRFLVWWQRSLTALLGRAADASRPAGSLTENPPEMRRGALSFRSPALAWAAGLALIVGAAGTIALSASGSSRPVAISAAVMTLVWAAVRWALLDAVARHRMTLARAEVRGAWALGSLAWAAGVTPELRVLAWAVSGAVTWIVLERLGASRRQTALGVGIAWGAQAFVVVGSWLATNAIVGFLATRG